MTEIVFAVAGKVSEYLVAPIGRHFGYLFCYQRHTDDLRNKVETLGTARDDLQITVNEATRRGDEIRPIVQDWLNRVDRTRGEAEELMMKSDENSAHNKKKIISYFNLKPRYQLGREACKKAQVIVQIQAARNFPDGVSYHVLPRTVTFKEYESFESRDLTLNQIMEALRDSDKTKKMIGVWGMGGVGKTTLLKQVVEEAKQRNLFTTQVYIDASWTREDAKFEEGISDIQQKIADVLGVEFKKEVQSTKADMLRQRLQKEKILIVLDDIWKEVDLEQVGIPSTSYSNKDGDDDCKIVLASRDENILRKDMGAEECFQLQHLGEEDAWQLLKKTVGDSVEGHELRPTATQIVQECQGLPVAIVTIGKALKGESLAVWQNALDELRSSGGPTNIRGVEEKVYGCLEWSYNHLNSEEAKSLFLLCGSLSHGDIWMDKLLKYAMGLDCFDRIESLEKAINKLIALVRILKASSLLLDDDGGYERETSSFLFKSSSSVRMHDVVRDVARIIASKHSPPFAFIREDDVPLDEDWSNAVTESKFIFLNCNGVRELPHMMVCPKLQFLLLHSSPFQKYNSPSLNIPDTFFEGMKGLKVLDLSRMGFKALPSTLQLLTNLRSLCLDWCHELRNISVIEKLKKLQILSMVGSNIQQLPEEMAQLTNLRLLDLNYCNELKVIPRNILSSLFRLECLFMAVNNGESNDYLLELNHLHHLRTIRVQIPDVKLVPTEDKFYENLTNFSIVIGDFDFFDDPYEISKTLKLKRVDGSLLLRSAGMGKLLEKTEKLELRELELVSCSPIITTHLGNLKSLVVTDCRGLKSLFSLSTARGLSQLEEMTIEYCPEMQQIVEYERLEGEDDHGGINLQRLFFPRLRSLLLCSLSNLISIGYFSPKLGTSQCNHHIDMPFCINQVSFSNMEKLQLIDLPKLKEIWHDQLPLDSLSNLGVIRVEDCPGLLNLIPCHLMGSFKNLKKIVVKNCKVLEHVFVLQCLDYTNVEILPKLETLKLRDLVGMKSIILCNNDKDNIIRGCFSPFMPVSFRNLKRLSISECGKEDRDQKNVDTHVHDGVLFGEKVSFPNLEELELMNLSMLKKIWHPQLSVGCFSKLRTLSVYSCPRLVNLIPTHLVPNLISVSAHNCEVLEHVFDHGGLNGDDIIIPKIEVLHLKQLPKMRLAFGDKDKNDNTHFKFVDFHHLKELHIINCEMALNGKVSFSPNLEELLLENISHLKEIEFGISPKLTTLKLKKLPEFCGIISNQDENMSTMGVFSSSTLKNFHNLRDLRIDDVGMGGGNRRDGYSSASDLLPNKKLCFLEAFESRIPAWNKIIDALRDDKMKMIGVCGMGGVGKTTLVKQAVQYAKEEKLFTTQVYADVFFWDTIRAADLKRRLKQAKEKILIIIDGIGEEIDLEEIGIPNFCKDDDDGHGILLWKVVLISREREVLVSKAMGFEAHEQVCIQLETLPPEEAWKLFEKTIATASSSSSSLSSEVMRSSIAERVVKECCEGVPLQY